MLPQILIIYVAYLSKEAQQFVGKKFSLLECTGDVGKPQCHLAHFFHIHFVWFQVMHILCQSQYRWFLVYLMCNFVKILNSLDFYPLMFSLLMFETIV